MPEPTLQTTALRYAAGDLTAAEAAAFETRLADDQDARDALAEAVRLSAAALGQDPPAPHRSFRAAIRERLLGYCPSWLSRRAYRGHPFVWVGLGALAVAACTLVGLALAEHQQPARDTTPIAALPESPAPLAPVAIAPEPRHAALPHPMVALAGSHEHEATGQASTCCSEPVGHTVAEIWADLSTPEHVEKMHDEELRWRQKLRELGLVHHGQLAPSSATAEH